MALRADCGDYRARVHPKQYLQSNYKEKEVIPNAGLLIVCLAVDSRLFWAVFGIVDVGSDRTGYIQW